MILPDQLVRSSRLVAFEGRADGMEQRRAGGIDVVFFALDATISTLLSSRVASRSTKRSICPRSVFCLVAGAPKGKTHFLSSASDARWKLNSTHSYYCTISKNKMRITVKNLVFLPLKYTFIPSKISLCTLQRV